MREIISIEVCTLEEIRFLRHGDFEYQIKGEKAVENFMNNLKEYSLFDEEEVELLNRVGIENYHNIMNKHNGFDFKEVLNMLDRHNVDILEKHSTLIN